MMNINEATDSYEKWLRKKLENRGGCDGDALDAKREEMRGKDSSDEKRAAARHSFLRGTFYRWAQLWENVENQGPAIRVVGDTHVENFGTWRDGKGRLVWGVNDFDETCTLPWVSDLVRLAVSATFAIKSLKELDIEVKDACDELLAGYCKSIKSGKAAPFVLEKRHPNLRGFARKLILEKEPAEFWENRIQRMILAPDIPVEARGALQSRLPVDAQNVQCLTYKPGKYPGMGGRGKRRYYAMAEWQGSYVLLEAKPIVPSAIVWTGGYSNNELDEMLKLPTRCTDPTHEIRGNWIMRRLTPDADKIELKDLAKIGVKKKELGKFFESMGAEIGNLHRASGKVDAIAADLSRREAMEHWFRSMVDYWEDRVKEDWERFRSS